MSEHPSEVELQRFVRGELPCRAARSIVLHLLQRCEVCLARLEPQARPLFGDYGGDAAASEHEYDQAIDRAAAGIALHGRRAVASKAAARRIKAALARGGTREARCEKGWGCTHATFDALLERAWELRFDNLREMLRLTRTACFMAPKLIRQRYSPAQVADFEARAWGEHANALRAAHRLGESEDALLRAMAHFAGGTRDLHLHVRLRDIGASLLAAQRRIAEAVEVLEGIYEDYMELGDRSAAGRALISQAIYVGHGGEPEQAVRLFDRALELLDETREADLVSIALVDKIWFLADAGQLRQARTTLWRQRRWMARYRDLGRINEGKLIWLEGHINAGLNELERAERCLFDARASLADEEVQVLVALELAAVWLRLGRLDEARVLAVESAERLLTLRLPSEAVKAVEVLRGALAAQAVTAGLLQSVVDYLRRSEHAPDACFVPRHG